MVRFQELQQLTSNDQLEWHDISLVIDSFVSNVEYCCQRKEKERKWRKQMQKKSPNPHTTTQKRIALIQYYW